MSKKEILDEAEGSQAIALEMSGVTRVFPGVRALDNVNLTVRYGEVHGVLGENGAGKSTLMAIASGALKANEGTVRLAGEELTDASPELARELGLAIVRQEPALLPDLTVAENLYLGVSPDKRPGSSRIEQWATEQLQLWSPDVPVRATDRVEQLQPQQRFIVEICRALSQDPKILVLDEPTEHLLRDEVSILFGHIREQVARGKAVVYISHRIGEVKEITDRLTVLRNGRTVGTFDASDTSEEKIVSLIIGRDLDVYFPEKSEAVSPRGGGVAVSDFSARGLAPLSMEFPAGQIIGLAGIEGNGQRDLLRALAGVERSTGEVVVGERRFPRYGRRAATGSGVVYLPGDRHNEGILSGLSVRENIGFRNLKKLSSAGWVSARRERALVGDVIAGYNVKTPTPETSIDSLSGGNQQKALIGSALQGGPRLFLVDEPTQGVDIGARSEIYQVMRRAANDGAVVIVLSSDAAELAGIADRVLVFSRGHVVRTLEGPEVSEHAITSTVLTADTERKRGSGRAGRFVNWMAGDGSPVAVVSVFVVALAIVGFIANPLFLGGQNISGVLTLTAVLGLVAFGQLLVLVTGGIDLSTGPLVGLVVIVASFYLIDGATLFQQGTGWVLMFVVALVIGGVNWVLIDLVKLSPIIATLVTYMAVQGISLTLRPSPGGVISRAVVEPIRLLIGPVPASFLVVLALGIVLGVLLKRSKWGIGLRAVGSEPEAARVNALNPRLIRLGAYLGSSLFAALAGVLFMAQTAIGDGRSGVNFTLLSITAAVVGGASVFGGRGSFIGALLGALLVQVVNALTVFLKLTPDWQYYLVGAMTLGAVAMYSIARKKAAARHA
ncbi:MAG: ATP-binding cassette domain-containing protein [Candidatus Leucobacter sulfamidivorax]|nr:ATP-binding cassette domain-containing protein [Candidatus Leucobacter sulfamidivorax]